MLVNRTAPAGVALALSGCLALGSAGTAFASGPESRQATAATADATADRPVTAAQFRVVERLGGLTRLTGTLGRLIQDSSADTQLIKSLKRQLTVQIRAVEKAVDRTRMNRPAVAPGDSRRARLAAAVTEFAGAVDGAVAVDRKDRDARAAASTALLAGLAKLNRAAAAEAGIPERLLRPVVSPAGVRAQRPAASERDRQGDRTGSLRAVVQVVTPVTDLLRDVLAAERGELTPQQIRRHSQVLEASFASAQRGGTIGERGTALAGLQKATTALLRTSAAGDGKKTQRATRETIAAADSFLAGPSGNHDGAAPDGPSAGTRAATRG